MPELSKAFLLLLGIASTTAAQGYGGYGGGSGNPYSNGNGNDDGNGDGFGSSGFDYEQYFTRYRLMVIAHAVLGTLAFGFFFPVGGIMIRLASFPGLWLVHGLFQAFAYLLYIAAFGIGIYMATKMPFDIMDRAHPIIGVILFILIFFQPFLGFIHHFAFKKHNRRVIWSYGHIWLGRIIITLGIINGGLGLQLAQDLHFLSPSTGAIIGYSVAAAIMWLLYVIAVIIGERKRGRATQAAPPPYRKGNGGMAQYA